MFGILVNFIPNFYKNIFVFFYVKILNFLLSNFKFCILTHKLRILSFKITPLIPVYVALPSDVNGHLISTYL